MMSDNKLLLAAVISAALLILSDIPPEEWRMWVKIPLGALVLWIGTMMWRRGQRRGQ